MGGQVVAASGSGWVRQSVWALGAVLASATLGTLCIMFGAMLAMVFEYGVPQSVGIAINGAALALMIGSYCVLIVVILRTLVSRWDVPVSVWPALGLFPLIWGLLVASAPGGPYQITPSVVTGVGAVVAWLLVGRVSGKPTAPLDGSPHHASKGIEQSASR